jgi:hypothetical protein
MKFILMAVSFCFATTVFAEGEHDHPPVKVSPNFENMKALIGTWEGTAKMGDKVEPVKVTYEFTSGNTAIVEKLNPGTPKEMTTVYANRGKEVNATHFCMLGNQPEMKLKQAKGTQFTFEMSGNKGISDKNEMHMHGVTLSVDGNKLKQEWTNFNKNKKGDVAVFEFTKKN